MTPRCCVIIYEGPADATLASDLADRVLWDEIAWLDGDLIQFQRTWIKSVVTGNDQLDLRWTNVPKLSRALGIRVYGHFDGQPGQPDALAARRAIAVVRKLVPEVAAIVLIRDSDKQLSRLAGLTQAQRGEQTIAVIVGLAIPEREAWVISGFDPKDTDEQERLDSERQRCGFDPRLRSDQLMATGDNRAVKSAKRVLESLVGNSIDRQVSCWCETSLATLQERGSTNGLAAYLDQVRTKLVPLIGSRR